MTEALVSEDVEVTIATTGEESEGVVQDTQPPNQAGCLTSVVCFRRNFGPYKVSFGLARWLRENVTKFDLVHIHALFSFSSTMAARIARKNNVPYIVRPLGV